MKYILAEKNTRGEYNPVEVYESIESLFKSLEYGDVFNSLYQVWIYPSGNIANLKAGHLKDPKKFYSSPIGGDWMVATEELEINKSKVNDAYMELIEKPNNIWEKVRNKLLHKSTKPK